MTDHARQDDMTEVKVILARMDEKISYLATKEDVAKLGERVAKVEGILDGKVGYREFLGVMAVIAGLIIAAPKIAQLLGWS